MLTSETVLRWVTPVAFLVGGFVLGWVLDTLVIGRLRKVAERTEWKLDGLILRAVGRRAIFWGGLAGAYMAAMNLPVRLSETAARAVFDTLFVIAALSVTALAARIVVGLIALYSERVEGVLPATSLFANLAKLLVYVAGGMIILQSLGIAITPILTALGVGGLAVALALQDTLSNLFSGFQIIASRHVQIGDYVKLATGEEGYVRDITWRSTRIENVSKFTFVVPNSKLAGATVTNYHRPGTEISLLIPCSVGYGEDLERVEAVTVEVAAGVMRDVPGGVPEFTPLVRYNAFGDSGVAFNAVLRVQEFTDQFLVRHEFIKRLHRRFAEEGIDIPFPQRTVHFSGDGLAVARNGTGASLGRDGAGEGVMVGRS
jgi:small-conductance mechanosensitive channel